MWGSVFLFFCLNFFPGKNLMHICFYSINYSTTVLGIILQYFNTFFLHFSFLCKISWGGRAQKLCFAGVLKPPSFQPKILIHLIIKEIRC